MEFGNDIVKAVANQLLIELSSAVEGTSISMRCSESNGFRRKYPWFSSRLHDAARLARRFSCRADRRARDADKISELLLAQVMAWLQLGVTDDVQKLIGQVETARTGGMRHDQRGFEDLSRSYNKFSLVQSFSDPIHIRIALLKA